MNVVASRTRKYIETGIIRIYEGSLMKNYRKTFLFLVLAVSITPGMATAAKLIYEVIEDVYDDVTQVRSVTEQAPVAGGKGWLLRTSIYTPVSTDTSVTFVPISTPKGNLFDSIQ
jgi:hypothetical protein